MREARVAGDDSAVVDVKVGGEAAGFVLNHNHTASRTKTCVLLLGKMYRQFRYAYPRHFKIVRSATLMDAVAEDRHGIG